VVRFWVIRRKVMRNFPRMRVRTLAASS